MTDNEKRAHDLSVHATIDYYRHRGEDITDKNAFEAGIYYRNVYKQFLRSLEEGNADLR